MNGCKWKWLWTAALACVASVTHAQYVPPPESSGGWRRLVPANTIATIEQKANIRSVAGLDWDVLKQAWDASSQYGGSFLVIRNGWIAAEWGTPSTAIAMGSCTKSVTALTMQRMFDMSAAGAFASAIGPDDLAFRYLPASWAEHPDRQTITIRNLLTMSSGLEPDDAPPSPSKDTTSYQLKLLNPPVRTTPWTEWSYASLPVDVLSLVAENVTGMRLGDFFQQQIGNRIGVTKMQWAALGTHTYASAYGSITARDLARISYLMLRGGTWGGESVVSTARVDEITRFEPWLAGTVYGPQIVFPTDPESHSRYGHLVWTNRTQSPYVGAGVPADAYYCAGFRTNFAVVIPSLDLIVVRLQNGPQPWSDALFSGIVTKVVQSAVSMDTNLLPTASLTGPSNGESFTSPASITLAADAYDADGSVMEVAFLANGTQVGVDNDAPYQIRWENIQAGSYSIMARVTDDDGASSASMPVTVKVNPPSGGSQTAARLNSGGGAYVDSLGRSWVSDSVYFTGGSAKSSSASVADTVDDSLYQRWRHDTTSPSQMRFEVPVSNGNYTVRLHFAEMQSAKFNVGARVFDVLIEGSTALSRLDVYAAAGARRAHVRDVAASVSDGSLTVQFVRRRAHPMISAIEIVGQ